MKMRSSCLFALIFGVAFSTFGACGDNPFNLLRYSNCGFDLDTSGWALVRGDLFVQHPGEGYSEAGAGYVEPTYYPSITRYEFELDGPCVPVLNFNCSNSSLYHHALLDDVFIVQFVAAIFADGFESGNTLEWSSPMP